MFIAFCGLYSTEQDKIDRLYIYILLKEIFIQYISCKRALYGEMTVKNYHSSDMFSYYRVVCVLICLYSSLNHESAKSLPW